MSQKTFNTYKIIISVGLDHFIAAPGRSQNEQFFEITLHHTLQFQHSPFTVLRTSVKILFPERDYNKGRQDPISLQQN